MQSHDCALDPIVFIGWLLSSRANDNWIAAPLKVELEYYKNLCETISTEAHFYFEDN